MDETGIRFVPLKNRTWAEKGAKQVEITSLDEKRGIVLVLCQQIATKFAGDGQSTRSVADIKQCVSREIVHGLLLKSCVPFKLFRSERLTRLCLARIRKDIEQRVIMNEYFGDKRLPQGPASQPLDPDGHWAAYVAWLHAEEGIDAGVYATEELLDEDHVTPITRSYNPGAPSKKAAMLLSPNFTLTAPELVLPSSSLATAALLEENNDEVSSSDTSSTSAESSSVSDDSGSDDDEKDVEDSLGFDLAGESETGATGSSSRSAAAAAADPLDEGLESNEPPPVAANVSKKRLSGAFRDEDVEDMDIQTARPNRKKKTPKSLDDYW